MTFRKLYKQYKQLPLWKKIVLIAFFPVVAIVIITMLVSNDITNEDVVKANKKKTDETIKSFNNSLKTVSKERQKIKEKREEIRKEIENAKTDHNNIIDLIDNADNTKLDEVAAELRRRSKSTTPTRNKT